MKLRSRLSTGTSGVEIVNKEDICHGSRNSSLAVGSADSDHHLACALLSLNGRRPQNVGEQLFRNGNLGHLERDVAAMADDLRANLDQLLLQGS